MTMTYPGFLDETSRSSSLGEIRSVTIDAERAGSLAQTLSMLGSVNANVKNLLTLEGWRVFERMTREFGALCKTRNSMSRVLYNALEMLLTQMMAYRQLVEESLFSEQGLAIYRIGDRIEHALLLVSKARSLLCSHHEAQVQNELLENLLLSCESLNAYRAHYRSAMNMENVIEFLLLDIRYPKSLIFQLSRLQSLLRELPPSRRGIYMSRCEEPLFLAFSKLRSCRAKPLATLKEGSFVRQELDMLLQEIAERLLESSNALSHTYFAHYDE